MLTRRKRSPVLRRVGQSAPAKYRDGRRRPLQDGMDLPPRGIVQGDAVQMGNECEDSHDSVVRFLVRRSE